MIEFTIASVLISLYEFDPNPYLIIPKCKWSDSSRPCCVWGRKCPGHDLLVASWQSPSDLS